MAQLASQTCWNSLRRIGERYDLRRFEQELILHYAKAEREYFRDGDLCFLGGKDRVGDGVVLRFADRHEARRRDVIADVARTWNLLDDLARLVEGLDGLLGSGVGGRGARDAPGCD